MKHRVLSLITISCSLFFIGCSSNENVMTSTLKATDYTMNCEQLLNEIKKYEAQYKEEKNGGIVKTITFGAIGSDKELEVMLRERIKNLELVYTMKKLNGDCKDTKKSSVTLNFTEIGSKK